uniref:Clone ZZD1431 mRNA sequence n=1 Tax=Schistosoma japonicum TaxID=6182 RepID=Q86ET7_SCHJA|nr:hypothetical protein [Schistosoma japonicum]
MSAGDQPVSGFVCPECLESFSNSESLMVHFESSHANLPISIEKSSVKGKCDGAYDKLDSYENLVAELTTHNLNLLNRVTDFEAVIHLLLNEAPLVDTSAIKDDELKKKVISFLDYQTLLAKSHSSIKSIEEDLAKKNETISLLRKQVDELQANSGIMKTDASTYICVDTKSVQSQVFFRGISGK